HQHLAHPRARAGGRRGARHHALQARGAGRYGAALHRGEPLVHAQAAPLSHEEGGAMSREKNFWGWGWADRFPAREARRGLGGQLSALLGFSAPSLDDPPTIDAIALRPSRVKAPDSLAAIVDGSHDARV